MKPKTAKIIFPDTKLSLQPEHGGPARMETDVVVEIQVGASGGPLKVKSCLTIALSCVMGWLCGSRNLTNITPTLRFREVPKPLKQSLTYGGQLPWVCKALADAVYDQREEIFDYFWQYIYNVLGNGSCAVFTGGRITTLHDYNGNLTPKVVKCPEFIEYLVNNKIGTVSASHIHQNASHTGANDFSCYQYWLWTPPAPGEKWSTRLASIDKKYVGLLTVPENATARAVRKKFIDYWSKTLGVDRRSKIFSFRMKYKE